MTRPAVRKAGSGDLALAGQVHLVAVTREQAHRGQVVDIVVDGAEVARLQGRRQIRRALTGGQTLLPCPCATLQRGLGDFDARR